MVHQRLAPLSHLARGSIRTLSLLVTAVAGVFSCTCSTASMPCVFLEGQRTRHTLISVSYTIEPLPAEVGNRIQYISVVTIETSSTITTRYARCTAARLTTHSARQPLNVYIVSIPHHSCHVCVPSIRGSSASRHDRERVRGGKSRYSANWILLFPSPLFYEATGQRSGPSCPGARLMFWICSPRSSYPHGRTQRVRARAPYNARMWFAACRAVARRVYRGE